MGANRRRVLRIAGATVLVGAGTGAAYEPWTNWRADDSLRALRLVRAAGLAANHSQPWLFRVSDERVDLFADTRRNIGAIDPFLREIMPFRIGYPTVEAKSSPRRDLKSVLV